VLGVAWDGSGYGPDGTVWGGEFLLLEGASARRVAHLRTFRLPGGERAVREPRRAALGALYEALGEEGFEDAASSLGFDNREMRVLKGMIASGTHAPLTSSAGRLFDAVAALAGVRRVASYEGQAAMELEWSIDHHGNLPSYWIPVVETGAGPMIVDWAPTLRAMLSHLDAGLSSGKVAAAFHRALASAIAAVAARIGVRHVALTGGCFQNRHLLEWSVEHLRAEGLEPFWHRAVPTNDGGISVGQAAWAAMLRTEG